MMRVNIPSYLPNLLSSLRITLAPAMLGAAYSNSKVGFIVLLVMALVTDALDGTLARRLGVASVVGQRLDRWGDGLTAVCGACGVAFLWLEIVEREWVWSLVALFGYNNRLKNTKIYLLTDIDTEVVEGRKFLWIPPLLGGQSPQVPRYFGGHLVEQNGIIQFPTLDRSFKKPCWW
jgi:hypothetical protein